MQHMQPASPATVAVTSTQTGGGEDAAFPDDGHSAHLIWEARGGRDQWRRDVPVAGYRMPVAGRRDVLGTGCRAEHSDAPASALIPGARHLNPGPPARRDEYAAALGHRPADRAGQPDRQVRAVVRPPGRQDEAGPVFADLGDNTAVHAPDLIDAAGDEHASRRIPAGLEMLLEDRPERVIVPEHVEVIDHEKRLGGLLLEDLPELIRLGVRPEDGRDPLPVGQGGEVLQEGGE